MTAAAKIIADALHDALLCARHGRGPLSQTQVADGILRMICARLTNEASPKELLKMVAAVGGPQTEDELKDLAKLNRERREATALH